MEQLEDMNPPEVPEPKTGLPKIMPKMSPLEELAASTCSMVFQTDLRRIGPGTTLGQMAGPHELSPKLSNLAYAFRRFLDTQIPPSSLAPETTVSSLASMIYAFPASVVNFEAELSDLAHQIQTLALLQQSTHNFNGYNLQGDILLTGASGYLGIHLLEAILAKYDPQVTVYCLLRAESESHARERLVSAGANYKTSIDWSRVRCLAGDLGAELFGLSPEVYAGLTERISIVYHNGAEVHFLKTYAQLRRPNVLGTFQVIRFALTGQPKELHYISTISVLGMDVVFSKEKYICIDEGALLRAKPFFHNGYAQTKWVAESLVGLAGAAGAYTTVHRPGNIGPHSSHPVLNPDDIIVKYIQACFRAGKFPQFRQLIPYSTVDWVAAAVVECGMKRDFGAVYHPVQASLTASQVFGNCGDLQACSMEDWIEACIEEEDGFMSLYLTEDMHSGLDLAGIDRVMPVVRISAKKTLEGLSTELKGNWIGEVNVDMLVDLIRTNCAGSL